MDARGLGAFHFEISDGAGEAGNHEVGGYGWDGTCPPYLLLGTICSLSTFGRPPIGFAFLRTLHHRLRNLLVITIVADIRDLQGISPPEMDGCSQKATWVAWG